MAESVITSLIAMGKPEDKVRKAFELANNDIPKAMEYIAKGMPQATPEKTPEKTPEILNEHGDEEKLEALPNGTPNEDNKNDDNQGNDQNQGNENENEEEMKSMSQNRDNMAMTPYRENNNNNNNNDYDNNNDNHLFPAFNDANKSRYEWEWSSHRGTRWHSYNQEVNNILNKNLFIGKSIQINMNGNLYEMRRIDETTATQRNTQTNKVRNVRRKEINEIVDKFAIQRIIDIINCTEKEARNAYIASNRDEERAINYILEESSKPRRQTRGGNNNDDDAWKSVFNKNEEQPFMNNDDEMAEFDNIYGYSDDENNNKDDKNNDKDQNNDQVDDDFDNISGHTDDENDDNNNNNNNNHDKHDKHDNNDVDEEFGDIYGHSDEDVINDKDENDKNNFQQNDAQSAAAQAALTRHNDLVKEEPNVELNDIHGNGDDDNDDGSDEVDIYGYSDNDNDGNSNGDDMRNID